MNAQDRELARALRRVAQGGKPWTLEELLTLEDRGYVRRSPPIPDQPRTAAETPRGAELRELLAEAERLENQRTKFLIRRMSGKPIRGKRRK